MHTWLTFYILDICTELKQYASCSLTLIERGSWMLLESVGGLNQPAPSRSPQNTVKNQIFFFDFWKVNNELGKVTKFWTSRPLFSWRNSHLKKVLAHITPSPHRVNGKQNSILYDKASFII